MITSEINVFLGFFYPQKSLSKFIFCSNHSITKNTGNHNIYSAVERGRLWLPRRTAQPEGIHTAQRRVSYLRLRSGAFRQTRQCFVGGIGLLYKICGIGFFKKCMLHDILNKKFKHL